MSELSIEAKRHSYAHIMTQAVKSLFWDDIGLWVWPSIENWFYQDFDFWDIEFKEQDIKKVEKKMKQIIRQNQKFEQYDLPVADTLKLYKTRDPYKLELSQELKEKWEKKLSFYQNVTQQWQVVYFDICKWPHVDQTSQLNENAFKLEKIAWAYWRWDEKNKMLVRIYWVAFENREELDKYVKMMAEAKKRDHRILWKKLELFTFDDEVGPWLPLWLPNGAVIIEELEKLAKEKEQEFGYKRVRSPHIAKSDLYLRSWHLPYYEEDMFPAMELDWEKYYLKAMNCPHHHKMYSATPKSYKDLPLKLAEYGQCYRYEDSGALFWLMRVRSLSMNDAHIYCTEDQFEEEFIEVIELYKFYFELFWIEKFEMRLSKHSKEGLWKKYVDNEKLWIKTENLVRKALEKTKVPFFEADWEWAFYWPKIDVQIWSAIWREFTLCTNQLDFAVPEKFNLKYIDKDWKEQTPLCIHRAPLSTHERFIWFLIEHFAWIFPLWLSPIQTIVIPVGDKFQEYADDVQDFLNQHKIRSEIDNSNDSLNKKIRNAEKRHINYILVVWEKEESSNWVAVRNYKTKEKTEEWMDTFVERILKEIQERRI